MGIRLIKFSSSSFDGDGKNTKEKQVCNPDPNKYSIRRIHRKNDFLILRVNYPDCENYEGNKILVFRNCTMSDLAKQGTLDPHFSDNDKFHSPVARFKPDDEGWQMAESFVENFKQKAKD